MTIGTIEQAAVFAGFTAGVHKAERSGLAVRSVAIAGVMLPLLALAGNIVLCLLYVALRSFQIAGGALLFLQALTLAFPRLTQ